MEGFVLTHEEVLTLVRDHLAEELEVDAAKISEGTRFKQDLDADSLDLYELVMELEDTYGISVSEEQAAKILTVGDAVAFVLEHAPA
jgi:acyl carrier protein